MNLRQAAQQALEALMKSHTHPLLPDDCEAAVTALRAALAEPEQEPVAWEQFHPDIGKPQTTHWQGCEAVHPECKATPRRPLTDEEMRECAQAMNAEPLAEGWPELIKFARAIERAHGIGEQHD